MKKFKEILKVALLVAVGMNVTLLIMALAIEELAASNLHLLALASGGLCTLGYFTIDEDERD